MWSPDQGYYKSTKENSEIIAKSDHGKWYGPRTPTVRTRPTSRSPQESPRLSLALFAKTPRISMGKVKIGHSKIKRVIVENPTSVAQSLHLDKNSEKKCFTLLMPVDHGGKLRINSDGTYEDLPCRDEFTVPAMSEVDLPILWKPDAEGSLRETITLKLGDLNRLHLIVFGNAVDTAPKPKHKMKTLLPEVVRKGHLPPQKRKISATDKVLSSKKVLQESNKGLPQPSNKVVFDVSVTSLKVKPTKTEKQGKGTEKKKRTFKTKVAAKGVAQSRLTLIKKSTEESRNIPRHPLPYVAKNMYFDEKWIEKQERGFVQWLNYILTPPDELTSLAPLETSSLFVMERASQEHSQPLAPTKEVLSFRAYTAKRKMARLRRSACMLYESQPLALVARTIESEVARNRLSIRPDKHFPQDLGIKETIVKMLLSYNSLWLRIGLETIYGEILPLQSNNDVVGLKRFLKSRFLANPDIAQEYRHSTAAEHYKPGYFETLNKFTLKKFLLLVLFLDKAKLTRLIDHDPCLFNKDAHYKCNRDLLLTFSRDYLKGEGDVTKHLSFLNYTVSHVQAPLDEMDYAVTNLAVDLRDGLRITRVIELLTQNWTFSSILRVPAISRLQKIHNVGVALNALKEREVYEKSNVDPRHIVDGHREKTLSFLWSIILHFQVNLVVNEKQIEEEISFLRKYHYEKNLERMSCSRVLASQEPTEEQDIYFNSKKLRLLLEWCRSVCRLYGVKVDNFTVSMSDGRVLCYLVHCYHPCLLREDDICQDTTQTCDSYTAEEDSLNESLNDSLTSKNDDTGYGGRLEELKRNERKNHKLCRDKVQELGGVPSMLKFTDMSSTIPDEKVVITYVSYLCARLLDLREEGRAARTIQLAWRKHCSKKRLQKLKRITTAALVIQKYFRSFQEKKLKEIKLESTLIIQAFCRGYQARRHLRRRHSAAAVIQSTYRSFIATKETQRDYENLKGATLRLQALVRGKISRRKVKRMKAARVIQCNWRRYFARDRFLRVKNSAIALQAVTRRFLARRRFKALTAATVAIQRRYKALRIGRKTREDYTKLRKAAMMLQARQRGTKARREVRRLRAVVALQKTVRMWQCRREFLERKRRVVKVQSFVRRIIAQRKYKKCVSSARVIQQRWRAQRSGALGRNSYLNLKASAVTVQSFYRSRIARRRFLSTRRAAIVIQAGVRGFLARKALERLGEACCVIQNRYRSWSAGKKVAEDYKKLRCAVLVIQRCSRGSAVRKEIRMMSLAAVKIQAIFRGYRTKKSYSTLRISVLTIQRSYRSLRETRTTREDYVTKRACVILLQSALRRVLCVRQFQRERNAARVIQTRWRALVVSRKTRKEYHRVRNSVITIQAFVRALKARREVKRERAAIKVQSAWRGVVQRRCFLRLREAAVVTQACFRTVAARRRYTVLKDHVVALQRKVRANQLCARQKTTYEITRGAIITLQAALRGHRARNKLRKTREATIKIQSSFRRHHARREYLEIRRNVAMIQRRRRAVVIGRRTRSEYQNLKRSVVSLQARVRCRVARREFQESREKIVKLQAAVRGFSARSEYRRKRHAAMVIQQRYRAYVTGSSWCVWYNVQKGACVTIQAHVRAWIQRRRYTRLKEAARVIRLYYTAWSTARKQKCEYQKLRSAVVSIQAYARGWSVRRLLEKCRAATRIQSWWKMCRAREDYTRERRCVVRVQSAVRAWLARRRYECLRRAAIDVQRRFRANRLCRTERGLFLEKKGSCLLIQHCYRFYRQRRLVEIMLRSVSGIRGAVLVIQRRYRAQLSMRHYRQSYLTRRSAVVTLQAAYRGYQGRVLVARLRAVVVIQSCYRGCRQRCEYKKLRNAVVKLQARARGKRASVAYSNLREAAVVVQRRERARVQGNSERKLFLEKRDGAVVIQRCLRGYQERTRYQKLRNVTIKTQALVRGKLARDAYTRLRMTTVITQRRQRAKVLGINQRIAFLKQKESAVLIQSWLRGNNERTRFLRLKNAAVRIQAWVRGRRARIAFERARRAAVVIQRRERTRVLGKTQRNFFLIQRKSVVLIQSYVRCRQQKTRYLELRRAVTKIQARVRGRRARIAFERARRAAVVIQRRERARVLGKTQRNFFLTQRKSVVLIQSYVRCRQQKKRYLELRRAITKIQARVRGRRARIAFERARRAAVVIQRRERARVLGKTQRNFFLTQRKSVVLIQSYVRCRQQKTRYLELRRAITKIQARVRGRRARIAFERARRAAVVIQRRERARVLGKTQRNFFLTQRKSVVLIQSYVRCRQQKTRYLELRRAITKIQARVRGRRACIAYRKLREAAIVIQRRKRAIILGKSTRNVYLTQRNSIVLIQSWVRGYKARENVRRIRAAQLIQKRYRACVKGRRARDDFVGMQMAAVTVQSWYRGHVTRKRFKTEKAARVIQAHVRGHQTRAKIEKIKREKAARLVRFSAAIYINLATIRLQRAYRNARAIALGKAKMDRLLFLQRWWRAKLVRLHFFRVRHLVCVMQTRWRARLLVKNQAAAKIQALVRKVLAKRAAESRKKAIVTIQSFWRGYHVRKQSSSGKIKKARQRVLLANANVTERMKLCNRTRSALDYLLNCKNLSTVLGALINLEIATRLSHRCTEQLVSDNALSVIFKVVRNSNRSLAHIELIKHALGIFVNVSKCPTTQGVVVTREPDSMDTLVELACIFREKPELFSRVCLLLTLLCGNEAIRKNLLSMGKVVSKIKSVYTLSKRKYDIDFKRNNAKSKRLSLSCREAKKMKNNTESSPLSAITALVDVLGLVIK